MHLFMQSNGVLGFWGRPKNHQAAFREAGESDLAPLKSLSLGNLAPKRVRICDARCLI